MHILKKVCYMTTTFKTIHFFYDSVMISREHLQQPTCQGNCLFSQYFLQPSIVVSGLRLIRENVEEYVYLRKSFVALLF